MNPPEPPRSVAPHGNVCIVHPELRAPYQRGIYLYAKSLIAAVNASGYRNLLLTDFHLGAGQAGSAAELYRLIDAPPREKIRSLQMLPRYLRHQWGGAQAVQAFARDDHAALTDKTAFLREVQALLNHDRFYELCRLASSKRFLPAVDVDFLGEHDCRVALTTAPLAIRSRSRRVKIIQTVHDLIVLNTSVHTTNVGKFRRRLESALSHADAILTVSEYTRAEIVERYPQLASKVSVVYQPIPADEKTVRDSAQADARAAVLARFGLAPKGFIFYVGAIEERKNIARLLKAHQASPAASALPLVFAGALDENYLKAAGILDYFFDGGPEGSPVARSGPHAVRYLGRITELEKLCLLREARLFAFPSITEGFGIPVLEAQSMGCPVLTTNASAIPEVVGASAVLVDDPTDLGELTRALERMAGDDALCARLAHEGLVNSRRFSRTAFADGVGALISSVAAGSASA